MAHRALWGLLAQKVLLDLQGHRVKQAQLVRLAKLARLAR